MLPITAAANRLLAASVLSLFAATAHARTIHIAALGDSNTAARAHSAAYYPQFFDGVAVNGQKLPQYKLWFDPLEHLNADGYQVVAQRIEPAVEALVKQAEASQ